MSQTPREIVTRCLKFENPERMPRDMWVLPWARDHYPQAVAEIEERFPSDFIGVIDVYKPSPRKKGEQHGIGEFVDEWGCVFINIQEGVHGEIRDPILKDLRDWKHIQPPYQTLPEDLQTARDKVNRFCGQTDKFVSGGCCPRPWERYQFLRGSENAMVDVMMPDENVLGLLNKIHEFFLREYEFWLTTDVDAVNFMDDWGAQNQLLIPPRVWRELFKPLYREYCDLAHAHGKFILMHSDGHISEIYDDLIEIGVDAINSQLFCMDMEDLAKRAKGKITFWGEIDRQHIMTSPDPQAGRDAVQKVARHFYDPSGGIIAQFEFGAGANPQVAMTIFEEWENMQQQWKESR